MLVTPVYYSLSWAHSSITFPNYPCGFCLAENNGHRIFTLAPNSSLCDLFSFLCWLGWRWSQKRSWKSYVEYSRVINRILRSNVRLQGYDIKATAASALAGLLDCYQGEASHFTMRTLQEVYEEEKQSFLSTTGIILAAIWMSQISPSFQSHPMKSSDDYNPRLYLTLHKKLFARIAQTSYCLIPDPHKLLEIINVFLF